MYHEFRMMLENGADESVLATKIREEMERLQEACCCVPAPMVPADVLNFDPEAENALRWLATTRWYRDGGWLVVRQSAYVSMHEKLDRKYHETWKSHVAAVKSRWPKPEVGGDA